MNRTATRIGTPTFKIYPDRLVPLLGYLLADLGALLWIAAWLYIGHAIYATVMTLSVIGDGLIASGRGIDGAVAQVQQSVSGLPLGVGATLRDALGPLHGPPGALISTGQNELQVIAHLALLLGVVVAGVPLLAVALWFIPWRIRQTRGFRNLDRMLRRPGAHAVSTTMQVLAGRALYTLPYDRLLHYSPDPIGEWREGRYYNLARATMAEEGLELRRYLRRMEGLAPLPQPPGLPVIGDD